MADSGGPDEPNTNTPEENRFLREQQRITETRLQMLEAEKQAASFLNATAAEKLSIEQKIVDTRLKLEEITLSLGEELTKQGSMSESQAKLLREQAGIKEKILKKAREENEEIKKETELVEKLKEDEKERYDQAVKRITEIQAINRRGQEAFGRISSQISGGLEARTPKVLKNLKDLVSVKQAQGLGGVVKALGGMSGVMLAAAKAAEFLFKAIMGARRELVEINRVTLGNREISKVYNEIAKDFSEASKMAFKFGVTSTEVGKTLTEIYKENSALQRLIEEGGVSSARQIAIVATKYKDFGISASQAAQVVDIATRSMGMGASETTELMKGLVEEASLAAQSPDKFISSFVTQYPKLRIYGDRSKEIFSKINKEASDIGVSFEAITGIGRSFESYESAAMASTQLNMLLGSNFDALQAMAATPEELTGMLRQNISESDLRQMSHFQRRYLANILNVEYDQLERIVSGKEAKDREQQRFDMLAESATHDSQRLEALLENIKSFVGNSAKSLEDIKDTLRKFVNAIPFVDLDDDPDEIERVSEIRRNKTLASANLKKLTEQRAANLRQGPDEEERKLVSYAIENGLDKAIERIQNSENVSSGMQQQLIDLMTKFVEDKSNVEATNRLFELFANNKISVEIE